MTLHFPIDSVEIRIVDKHSNYVLDPIYTTPRIKISETEFSMTVDKVASYHVQGGNKIQVLPDDVADQASIQLFLSGSILGAVLHQQGTIPFHGSSFELEGKGIVICGHSGAGKSSIAAAFCQNEAHFINDDITPVSFEESSINILPIRTKIKLWDDALQTLHIEDKNLERIRPSMEKYYVPLLSPIALKCPLNMMVILCTHNDNEYKVIRPTGIDKYNLIRKNIYRKMYLRGMPHTEQKYFQQILELAGTIDVLQVFRPKISDIHSTMKYIRKQLLS